MLCSSFKVTKDCKSGVGSFFRNRGKTEIGCAGVVIILIEFQYPGQMQPRNEGCLNTLTVMGLTYVQAGLRLFRSFVCFEGHVFLHAGFK